MDKRNNITFSRNKWEKSVSKEKVKCVERVVFRHQRSYTIATPTFSMPLLNSSVHTPRLKITTCFPLHILSVNLRGMQSKHRNMGRIYLQVSNAINTAKSTHFHKINIFNGINWNGLYSDNWFPNLSKRRNTYIEKRTSFAPDDYIIIFISSYLSKYVSLLPICVHPSFSLVDLVQARNLITDTKYICSFGGVVASVNNKLCIKIYIFG